MENVAKCLTLLYFMDLIYNCCMDCIEMLGHFSCCLLKIFFNYGEGSLINISLIDINHPEQGGYLRVRFPNQN